MQRNRTTSQPDASPEALSGSALPEVSVAEASAASVAVRENSAAPRVFLLQLDTLSPNQHQTLALACGLVQAGWNAHIVCRKGAELAERARSRDIAVDFLPAEGERGLSMLWSLFRALRGNVRASCVLHACDPAASLLAATAWRMNKSLHIVHTRRMPEMESDFKAMKRYAAPEADIITDTLAGKVALQLSGLGTRKVHTIPCGIDPAEYPKNAHCNQGRFVHAVMGEMVERRGHAIVYGAMSALLAKPSSVPWEVRFLGDGPAFPALLEEAKAEGLERYMAFLCEADETLELSRCDSLLLPAADGESNIPLILQGWACGVPVIAVNRLDYTETLVADVNCLLVQSGDVGGFAENMLRLAQNEDLRQRLVQGGQASLERYSRKAMVAAHMALYRRILALPPA